MQETHKTLRIVLCGYGRLALGLLEGVLTCSDHCELVAVFPWSLRGIPHPVLLSTLSPKDRGLLENDPDETAFRNRLDDLISGHCKTSCPSLEILSGEGLNHFQFMADMQRLKPDIVLIGSWGERIAPHVLSAGFQVINCHPSLLPAHRGPNPYSSVIRMGEFETGVTLHRVVARFDAGPILAQHRIEIDPREETSLMLRDKCAQAAQKLITHFLQAPLQFPENSQNEEQASYFPALKTEDGRIPWHQDVIVLDRHFRGVMPWLTPYTLYRGWIPVFFHFIQIVPCPPIFQQHNVSPSTEKTNKNDRRIRAGRLLGRVKQTLWITLEDPKKCLQVTGFHFTSPSLAWAFPTRLSEWVGTLLFRAGDFFS